MKNLIIIGTGGFAREVYWLSQSSQGYKTQWTPKGFLDGDVKLAPSEYKKLLLPLLGDINSYQIQEDDVFVIAIADVNGREKIAHIMEQKGAQFISIIPQTCHIPPNSAVGKGCVFYTGVGISDCVTIGDFVLLNAYTCVGHDAQIGDFSSVMGYVAITGNVKIGKKVTVATGAKFVPHAKVEDGAYVGIGSVVIKKVRAGKLVFGNPAKEMDI